ncbi:MAG TPA: carboxypeptidase regulatory-like domain-containing protein [Vicinamibacterales bacterium]|nr:carboxypeptidase regulatory-like domain-containing protein [Vicinamibacterales bacterium]
MRKIQFALILAGFLFAIVTPLFAQQGTSEIAGKVTDTSGAVLPGVSIVVTNEATGIFRDVTTSTEGTYFVSQLVPGRYKVVATLAGFQTTERPGLLLQVGNTLTINLTLGVGGLAETLTVTSEAPLVDTTSARVGGNIGTEELAETPATHRNYFAIVSLLPGVVFTPSNQMGNDTIVAAGQTSQNNNVSVDGGYNADDALGTSAGAQVRTPLEAIQEFQVMTSMYDAEFGRASGAILNAVTKTGTNQFKGVLFGSFASNRLTARDFLVRQGNLPKPTTTQRDWGGVIGGPVVRNKAHFFFSLERQIDNPNRTRVFPTRPQLDFSIAEDRTDWNTLVRFDHQINAAHTWAVRWLREWAPQWNTIGNRQTLESYQDETDLDQTAVGTLTSVLGNTRVNTVRVARTWEHWWHGNACFRAQGSAGDRAGFTFGDEASGDQALCPPQLNYTSFLSQASTESQGPWDSNYQIEDDYSWFVPGKKGDHELKFGARYNYTELRRVSQINSNGTFVFNTDLPFDAANPRTYPERLMIRLGTFNEFINNHTVEGYAQDKWKLGRTTISAGLRYDLEIIPLNETDNPLFPAANKSYPVDRNNIAPRIGLTHALDGEGRSVVRGGYGIFYNRTILGALDDTIEFPKYTSSAVVNFPNDNADPGPTAGRLPTDPFLMNGPFLNRALLNQRFPPGTLLKNNGLVVLDVPNRQQPYAHQMTVGYSRELTRMMAIQADYIHIHNKDMFLGRNLNPMVRANTTRTGAITRTDAFGVLGEAYSQQVWVMENTGESKYDALNFSLEKRYSNNWSGRVSYSLSNSRGTSENQADRNVYQYLTDLHLDEWYGPSGVDHRHNLKISGRADIPKTHGVAVSGGLSYLSGAPFTLIDSSIDADQNGELMDPLPAGTYSGTALNAMKDVKYAGGRNGAVGPDSFQLNLRAGWRARMPRGQALELFLDIFNVTNRVNWENPRPENSDRRTPSTFLVLTNLAGGGGFPRQAQMGVRYVF